MKNRKLDNRKNEKIRGFKPDNQLSQRERNDGKMKETKVDSEKLKKTLRIILLIIAMLIVIVLIVLTKINNSKNSNQILKTTTNEEIVQQNENAIISKITKMSEEERVKSYVGQFISQIEGQNYEAAYKTLNEKFKNNYFKTLDDFKNYAKKKYPSNPSLTYESVKRMGEVYLVQAKINDVINSDFTEFTQRFVVRENGANNYVISFQVE